MRLLSSITLLIGFLACLTYQKSTGTSARTSELSNDSEQELSIDQRIIVKAENSISKRFPIQDGFERKSMSKLSFASYLLDLPLKDYHKEVLFYHGGKKTNSGIYCGVIDMDIDPVDLQQCADAVMRLRGEYLFEQKRYQEIRFNFLSDGKPRYFVDYAKGDLSYKKFRKYMKYIFSYANTRSLHDELSPISDPEDIMAGDVFVQKGKPYGHAVIVLDVIHSIETDEKRFILAQSYMPAQESQILLNPILDSPSPWYSTNSQRLVTPEWTFTWEDLRRFPSIRP